MSHLKKVAQDIMCKVTPMAMGITKTLIMPIAKGITRCNEKLMHRFWSLMFICDILWVPMDAPWVS